MQKSSDRLDGNTRNDKHTNDGVVRLDVGRSFSHPDTHAQRHQGSEPCENLPDGVQNDRQTTWQETEDHGADGEKEGERQAAQDAVGLLDGGFEAGLCGQGGGCSGAEAGGAGCEACG